MNILVLGNGFDLAHGLPTRYTDFLDFVETFVNLTTNPHIMGNGYLENISKPKYKCLDKIIFKKTKLCDELKKHIVDNFWIDYFLQNPMYQKENWIDFESEISKIIQNIDEGMQKRSDKFDDTISSLDNKFLSDKFLNSQIDLISNVINGRMIENKKSPITYNELILLLEKDLNKLIRALEIYLSDYVSELKIERKLSDIQELDIDHVLSFNYTDTYEKIYGKGKKIDYGYIHGRAKSDNTIDSNNMVLGIDEYLTDDRRNKDVEFIAFKKYYQRIYKQTGCVCKEWVERIKKDALKKEKKDRVILDNKDHSKDYMHNLYIFGHSLDVTDRDILRDLILHDNVHTTIFYPDKKELGRKITNLVKVIGQDELIKRTGGSTKTIEFEPQQGR